MSVPTKYPRICWAARRLGVSRRHLFYVLNGERTGRPGLIADYERLRDKGATFLAGPPALSAPTNSQENV